MAVEKANAIGANASGERSSDDADALIAEISPIALSFPTKHPLTDLPAIPDLAADEASGPFAAARSEGCASRVKEIPTVAALTPATIGADVEAGPIVDRGHNWGRRCLDSQSAAHAAQPDLDPRRAGKFLVAVLTKFESHEPCQ